MAMTAIHNKDWPATNVRHVKIELHEDRAGCVVQPGPPTVASVLWSHGIPCIELLEANKVTFKATVQT